MYFLLVTEHFWSSVAQFSKISKLTKYQANKQPPPPPTVGVYKLTHRSRVRNSGSRSESNKRRGHSPGNIFPSFNLNQPVKGSRLNIIRNIGGMPCLFLALTTKKARCAAVGGHWSRDRAVNSWSPVLYRYPTFSFSVSTEHLLRSVPGVLLPRRAGFMYFPHTHVRMSAVSKGTCISVGQFGVC